VINNLEDILLNSNNIPIKSMPIGISTSYTYTTQAPMGG